MRNGRADARFVDAAAELLDFGGIERLGAPLIRILAENLNRFATVDDGTLDGLGNAAGH
jgi:hypothetical protein